MTKIILLLAACGLTGVATAQVDVPPTTPPAGEARPPTQPRSGAPPVPADDCRRQADQVRQQFEIQETAIRREMDERARVATTEGERAKLRTELQQRLATLKLQAAEAQQRVMQTCRTT